jgi:hypothetical protein
VTGLETTLISAGSFAVGVVGTIAAMRRQFVPRSECALRHQGVTDRDRAILDELKKIKCGQNVQFEMIRKIIVRLGLDPKEMDEILNVRGDA